MLRVLSMRGKLYAIEELDDARAIEIAQTNGYQTVKQFADRFAGWYCTIAEKTCAAREILPVWPHLRGRGIGTLKMDVAAPKPKNRKKPYAGTRKQKRPAKYGFDDLLEVGDHTFRSVEESKVLVAYAIFFGRKFDPHRKFTVKKANVDGINGYMIIRIK